MKSKVVKKSKTKSFPRLRKTLLHPVHIFLLLCIGVMLSLTTFRVTAESVTVTAEVSPTSQTARPIQRLNDPCVVVGVMGPVAANVVQNFVNCNLDKFADKMRQWGKYIWPAFSIVSLMTVSFWLGEKEIGWRLASHLRR